MQANDVQLIHNILSGEDVAFSTLIQKYRKSVHALAWRKIGDFHIAEEITQDTFLQVHKKLATLRNPNQFAAWLYAITNRLCSKWYRENRPITVQSLESTNLSIIDKLSYRYYEAERREAKATERYREIVRNLLWKLPKSERRAVVLYYFSEMSMHEIGEILGVPTNTIKSHIYRARKRLQGYSDTVRYKTTFEE